MLSHTSRTWQEEARVISFSSLPLVLTYVLQYSLTVTSVFTVGRLGTVELSAVSLGSMTVNLTGYAAYQGLAAGLDTLCPQAYGAGNKKLVGVHFLRMVCFLWAATVPIGIIWWNSETILGSVLSDKLETVHLASIYLKILLVGAPGWSVFECGKRFLQAQGIFTANLHILLLLAPLNAFLHWLFVFGLKLGFIGAPLAVVTINCLMPISLALYISSSKAKRCWVYPSMSLVFTDWGPMVRLAVPGLIMSVSEWAAFEILTLWAGLLGSTQLAAQGILITLANLGCQLTIPVALAASTRVSNLIGASQAVSARRSAKVASSIAFCVALFNATVLLVGKTYIPRWFSLHGDALHLTESMMPFIAAFQFIDAQVTCCQGLLRSLGRQKVGGYACLFVFNVCALPLAYVAGFIFHWDLLGLWIGPSLGSATVLVICGVFLCLTSWEDAVEEALARVPLLAK